MPYLSNTCLSVNLPHCGLLNSTTHCILGLNWVSSGREEIIKFLKIFISRTTGFAHMKIHTLFQEGISMLKNTEISIKMCPVETIDSMYGIWLRHYDNDIEVSDVVCEPLVLDMHNFKVFW